jgi:hypothetical protein
MDCRSRRAEARQNPVFISADYIRTIVHDSDGNASVSCNRQIRLDPIVSVLIARGATAKKQASQGTMREIRLLM